MVLDKDAGIRINPDPEIAYDEAMYPLLCQEVTAETVKAHLSRNIQGEVVRYEMPNVSPEKISSCSRSTMQ